MMNTNKLKDFKVLSLNDYSLVSLRDESIKSCEYLIDENLDSERLNYVDDVKMPVSKVENIKIASSKKKSKNSVVDWDKVRDTLIEQSKTFFNENATAKIAIFSRSELIEIINGASNRKKEEYWTNTSEYAKKKTSLRDEMSISQARYDSKFNELVMENAKFIRVNQSRRKFLGVKKV